MNFERLRWGEWIAGIAGANLVLVTFRAWYKVTGTDSFHVIQGEAELETPDGERIELTAGGIYSFPDGFTATWRTRSPFMKFFVIA